MKATTAIRCPDLFSPAKLQDIQDVAVYPLEATGDEGDDGARGTHNVEVGFTVEVTAWNKIEALEKASFFIEDDRRFDGVLMDIEGLESEDTAAPTAV